MGQCASAYWNDSNLRSSGIVTRAHLARCSRGPDQRNRRPLLDMPTELSAMGLTCRTLHPVKLQIIVQACSELCMTVSSLSFNLQNLSSSWTYFVIDTISKPRRVHNVTSLQFGRTWISTVRYPEDTMVYRVFVNFRRSPICSMSSAWNPTKSRPNCSHTCIL